MVLLCTVQKLRLFFITPNMVIRQYFSILKITITFEPYIVEPILLAFTYVLMVCKHDYNKENIIGYIVRAAGPNGGNELFPPH